MSIPKGCKLVPVEPTEEMLSAMWSIVHSHGASTKICYEAMLAAAPAPPQPIYDEAKERELFAEWWRNTPILRVNKLQLAEAAWLACAQSRAKAGEVSS